jgi:hypothetical protein
MRNLGGAIGLAMIDTVIYTRSPALGAGFMERLQALPLDGSRGLSKETSVDLGNGIFVARD